jgi:hypothetical protein
VLAQKNAVVMPRRMSAQATSIRTQSVVTARDGELCILDLQTWFSAVRDVWIRGAGDRRRRLDNRRCQGCALAERFGSLEAIVTRPGAEERAAGQ